MSCRRSFSFAPGIFRVDEDCFHFFETDVKPQKLHTMKNLNEIAKAGLSGITAAYKNETRSWWGEVNEDAVYAAIADPAFAAFVDRVVEDATSRDLREAV